MASISTDKRTGRRRVLFVAPDGKRKTIRLGKIAMRAAATVRIHVEHLAGAAAHGHAPPDETARWLAERDGELLEKLVAVGLAKPRESATLGAFLDGYIASRQDVKPLTRQHLTRAARELRCYFGEAKPLRDIHEGDADSWWLHLVGARKLGENTARRIAGRAKQFFTAARKRKLVGENPFAGLKASVRANASRFYFVSAKDAAAVLEACPDTQWKLIFMLARYGGLRTPSETVALRWGDVDWERGRINVQSPKTERHCGGESRWIPLFPELRPLLETAFDEAPEGTEHVITRYRDSNANLRTEMLRIIAKAGLNPWCKLFQNCRSTRETELAETYPLHVVTAWLGNSQPVAVKHYLQVTDEHFQRAAQAAQNPAQTAHEEAGQAQTPDGPEMKKPRKSPGLAECVATCPSVPVPPLGLEPRTY